MVRFILLFLFVIPSSIFCQNKPDYFKVEMKANQAMPDWAQLMYSDDPNVYEVDQLFEKYYQDNTYQKTLDGQNYKYWRKQIDRFLDENG